MRKVIVVILVLLAACGGNQALIDSPPKKAASQEELLAGVPPKYRSRLKKMLAENLRRPGTSGLLYEMALLYQLSGKPDSAQLYYEGCLQAEPKHVPCAVNLAALHKLRDKSHIAIAVLEELFSAGADDPRARTDLAVLYRLTGDLKKSTDQSRYVLKNFGQLYGARLNLGMIYQAEKKYELALSIFTDLVKEFPDDAKAHFNLGFIYQELGAFGKARIEYDNAVSYDTNAFEAFNNLGLLMMFRQSYVTAETLFRQAISANVNFAPAHLNLGIALRNLKKYRQAADEYRKALELQENLQEARYNLAILYDDYLGLSRRATRAWKIYLDKFEDEIEDTQKAYIKERLLKLAEDIQRSQREELEEKEIKEDKVAPVTPPPAENGAELPGTAVDESAQLVTEETASEPLQEAPKVEEGVGENGEPGAGGGEQGK